MKERSMCRRAYRLVEYRNGKLFTLFHGLPSGKRRSREIPLGVWLKAEQKMVRDGTGPWYLSGFNVLLRRGRMEDYAKRFKATRELWLVSIWVNSSVRVKTHSRSDVWLADWMMIPEQWVEEAIRIK